MVHKLYRYDIGNIENYIYKNMFIKFKHENDIKRIYMSLIRYIFKNLF